MSRIGKKVIILPEKTELSLSDGLVSVKGPLGELKRSIQPVIEVKINGSEVTLVPKKETKDSNALWGTTAAHLTNMVKGVNTPFEKKLILEGIGYKSEVTESKQPGAGSIIKFALGLFPPGFV